MFEYSKKVTNHYFSAITNKKVLAGLLPTRIMIISKKRSE
jgi:hypothetical protein